MSMKNMRGFTLLEMMVVTLFLSIIGIYTWTYMRTTFKSQKSIEEKTDIQQSGVSIMNRLSEDISQVFYVESFQKLTFFEGEQQSLKFTTLSHDPPNPEDRESDQAKIAYTLEDDSDSANGTKKLMRKEVPYFTPVDDKDEEYVPIPVSRGIENLQFSYSDDGTKFLNEWNVLNTDHLNKLPKLVKIAMTVKDENDREEYFETIVNLPLTEDINTQAAATKAPTPGTSSSGTKSGTTGTSTGTTSKPATTPPATGGSNETP